MTFKVIITENYEQMSQTAAGILIPDMRTATVLNKRDYGLGLSTGNSPNRLYDLIVERQGEFNAARVRGFSIDEYVLLPGETHTAEEPCKESYEFELNKKLISRLTPTFKEFHIPPGTQIYQNKLEEAILESGSSVAQLGDYDGKAIKILSHCQHPYLANIRDNILPQYINELEKVGGIDWWIRGTGEQAHMGLHESGVPLDIMMLLAKLSKNTIDNAITDGHISQPRKYALSLGAQGIVYYSVGVLVIASGDRKTQAVTESLLGEETSRWPTSVLQRHRYLVDKHVIYVIDEIAAAGILGKERQLEEKGIHVHDRRH